MPSVLIRNLDETTVCALKERAAKNGRSVQQELHAIVAAAVEHEAYVARKRRAFENAQRLREELGDRVFSDSTLDIRADRDSGYGHNW
jgi:plasmid stability protein